MTMADTQAMLDWAGIDREDDWVMDEFVFKGDGTTVWYNRAAWEAKGLTVPTAEQLATWGIVEG